MEVWIEQCEVNYKISWNGVSKLILQTPLDKDPNLTWKEIDLLFSTRDTNACIILFLDSILIYFPYNDDLIMPS